jgi:death-on-curing protein
VIEPVFLDVEDILQLHADQLERYGGLAGIRDANALESAVSTASASFDGEFLHQGLFAMAAAYAFHIAENQAFLDGNKRTALNAALVFLLINGWLLQDPEDKLYDAMIAISARTLTKDELASLFEQLAVTSEIDEAF